MLGACASGPNVPVANYPAPVAYPTTAASPAYAEYGRVAGIDVVQSASGAAPSPSSGSGVAGAVIGAVVGGALGNQIGSGSGRAAATALGAVGGAVAGNQIARRSDGTYASPTGMVYRITVQTDNGTMRAYDVGSTGDLRVGDRVRIENNTLYRS
ncbi:MAG TPA: glycine zipper 2TM domain-containing protein [Ramlibacter sp.]|nr:glycine zipper 2TM domain-containing protein [Ramlibacter sp.]